MKLLKVCWYSLMAVSFIAGLITGRREFFLLLFIMGFVPIFSLCLNLWTARSFCYLQDVGKSVCHKGDQTSMSVVITNDKPFPFSLMRITMLPVARSETACESFSLLPGSRITFTVPMLCPYRGIFNVGIMALEINDSLGLIKTTFDLSNLPYYRHIEVKVYPKLIELGALAAGGGDCKHIGSAGKWNIEQGEAYSGLRPYRPGDPLKRVHRAVSSHKREWYVRTYDAPLETSILIALDTTASFIAEEDGLYMGDLACECAAAIARYSLKAGYCVIYSDAGLASAFILRTLNDFQKLYDRLTELRFEADSGNPERFTQIIAKQSFDTHAAYIISARGGSGIERILSPLDTARINTKLIMVGLKKSDYPSAESKMCAIAGVQVISVALGDDVAAVLGQ